MTVLLFIFLYLVIGAAAPFYHYKPVSGITKANTSASAFYQDGPGCDRAMILETNQNAWDERMRLMSLAKERIILSTFDFRDGESPRDRKEEFPEMPVYTYFQPPRWLCRVGDFKSIEEAHVAMRKLKSTGNFKEVAIVREQINIPIE